MSLNRIDEIFAIIQRRRSVSVAELTKRLGVSEVTIRKDLNELENKAKIIRTHGRAQLAEDQNLLQNFYQRKGQNQEIKSKIASLANEKLIKEGDSIYIDAGSTALALCDYIKDKQLKVISNSLPVLNELASSDSIELFSTGGQLRRDALSFIGPIAEKNLAEHRIETAFLGCSGITFNGIFTAQNLIEANLKKRVVQSARRRVVLADSSKAGKEAFSLFARSEDIDLLITNSTKLLLNNLEDFPVECILID